MFTGLIEQQGEVEANIIREAGNHLVIRTFCNHALQVGESIAINGVCLTLKASQGPQSLSFDVSPHTLQLTNLSQLSAGDRINFERSMLASTRFGGHYVSGHVDTTARLISMSSIDEYAELVVGDFPACSSQYLIPKGSITLDGVSLTINAIVDGAIQLMLVPHTLAETTLGQLKIGQRLNVEFDYLARIVAHQLEHCAVIK